MAFVIAYFLTWYQSMVMFMIRNEIYNHHAKALLALLVCERLPTPWCSFHLVSHFGECPACIIMNELWALLRGWGRGDGEFHGAFPISIVVDLKFELAQKDMSTLLQITTRLYLSWINPLIYEPLDPLVILPLFFPLKRGGVVVRVTGGLFTNLQGGVKSDPNVSHQHPIP